MQSTLRNPMTLYLDVSRAFDRVPHHLLLQDLADRDISGKALEWMQSFLRERTQMVRVSSAHSVKSKVTSGVIQGSSLETTLFNIYMDSLLHKLNIPESLQHPMSDMKPMHLPLPMI